MRQTLTANRRKEEEEKVASSMAMNSNGLACRSLAVSPQSECNPTVDGSSETVHLLSKRMVQTKRQSKTGYHSNILIDEGD